MQRHHGALAEADQRQRRRRQIAAREFGVEECVEHRRGRVDAAPALVRIAEGERKPFAARSAPGRRAPARAATRRRRPAAGPARRGRSRSGRCRRRRSRAGTRRAAARCPSAARAADRRVQPFFDFLVALSSASACLRCRLNRRRVAPLDHAIIGPQQMRRHPAPRPPGFGERELLRVRPLAQAEARCARLPARRGRRPARHRHGRGRTADRCRRSTARCRAAR